MEEMLNDLDRTQDSDVERLVRTRSDFQVRTGQLTMVLAAVERYKELPLRALWNTLVEPLAQERVLIATPKSAEEALRMPGGVAGLVIWATVSDDVERKIVRQIENNRFPIQLDARDWTSGKNLWLLDVIAPTPDLAKTILEKFSATLIKSEVRLHPVITEQFGLELLAALNLRWLGNVQPRVLN